MGREHYLHGTCHGWSVEARSTFRSPQSIGGQLFDERWQSVHFDRSTTGVPIGDTWNAPFLTTLNLFGYAAAQALRWWFHAQAPRSFCLETRLVQHLISFDVNADRVKESHLVRDEDGDGIFKIPTDGAGAVP